MIRMRSVLNQRSFPNTLQFEHNQKFLQKYNHKQLKYPDAKVSYSPVPTISALEDVNV